MLVDAAAAQPTDPVIGGGLTFALQNLLQRHDSLAAESKHERETMVAKVDKLESENRYLAARNAKLEEQNQNHLLNLDAMDHQIERADAENKLLMDTLTETQHKNKQLMSRSRRLDFLDAELEDLELRYGRLQSELETMKNDHRLENRNKDLASRNAKLERQNQIHLLNLAAMDDQIERADAEIKALTRGMTLVRLKNEALEARLERTVNLDSELETLELQYGHLQDKLGEAQEEHNATINRLGQAEAKLRFFADQVQKFNFEARKNNTKSLSAQEKSRSAAMVERAAAVPLTPLFIKHTWQEDLSATSLLSSIVTTNDNSKAVRRRKAFPAPPSAVNMLTEKVRWPPSVIFSDRQQTTKTATTKRKVGINQKGPIRGSDLVESLTGLAPTEQQEHDEEEEEHQVVHVNMLNLDLLAESLVE